MYEFYGHATLHGRVIAFYPVTPNEPKLKFDLITFVEGIKLINMYESHDHTV